MLHLARRRGGRSVSARRKLTAGGGYALSAVVPSRLVALMPGRTDGRVFDPDHRRSDRQGDPHGASRRHDLAERRRRISWPRRSASIGRSTPPAPPSDRCSRGCCSGSCRGATTWSSSRRSCWRCWARGAGPAGAGETAPELERRDDRRSPWTDGLGVFADGAASPGRASSRSAFSLVTIGDRVPLPAARPAFAGRRAVDPAVLHRHGGVVSAARRSRSATSPTASAGDGLRWSGIAPLLAAYGVARRRLHAVAVERDRVRRCCSAPTTPLRRRAGRARRRPAAGRDTSDGVGLDCDRRRVGRLCSAVMFGLLWTRYGDATRR